MDECGGMWDAEGWDVEGKQTAALPVEAVMNVPSAGSTLIISCNRND